MKFVWLFSGVGSHFATGAFERLEDAEGWISKHRLSGVLTKYPVNFGAYDWAISEGLFRPKTDEHTSGSFIGRFGCASFEHYHYEEGKRE